MLKKIHRIFVRSLIVANVRHCYTEFLPSLFGSFNALVATATIICIQSVYFGHEKKSASFESPGPISSKVSGTGVYIHGYPHR